MIYDLHGFMVHIILEIIEVALEAVVTVSDHNMYVPMFDLRR